jgi:hypothetical protein
MTEVGFWWAENDDCSGAETHEHCSTTECHAVSEHEGDEE